LPVFRGVDSAESSGYAVHPERVAIGDAGLAREGGGSKKDENDKKNLEPFLSISEKRALWARNNFRKKLKNKDVKMKRGKGGRRVARQRLGAVRGQER
jgi:hypothetical protein